MSKVAAPVVKRKTLACAKMALEGWQQIAGILVSIMVRVKVGVTKVSRFKTGMPVKCYEAIVAKVLICSCEKLEQAAASFVDGD